MSSGGKKLTHEEWLKKKNLESARRAGKAPAEVDEDGNEINPNIPNFISEAPWYYGNDGKPSLKHQHQQPSQSSVSSDGLLGNSTGDVRIFELPRHGLVRGPAAQKFRKGACTNCGALTHTAKECCERPRAIGAKYSHTDIMPDEYIPAPMSERERAKMPYDAKMDRWAGYDVSKHDSRAAFFAKVEAERRAQGLESADGKDGFFQGADYNDAPDQKRDENTHQTVRNLRIREDTAKYLLNLDVDSAYYDPKTRAMRGNPFPDADPNSVEYAGDNFARSTGDAQKFAEAQLFVLEASAHGTEINLAADPSQAELLMRTHSQKKAALEHQKKEDLLERYGTGGAQYTDGAILEEPSGKDEVTADRMAQAIRFSQTEDYAEYSKDGRVIGGTVVGREPVRSKWEEDVLINNHTAVWGSWWDGNTWGYACCHSTVKNSFCTGMAGIQAKKLADAMAKISQEGFDDDEDDDNDEDKDKKGAKRQREGGEKTNPYKKARMDIEVTEESMEEYRKNRIHPDDPILKFQHNQDT